MTARWLGMVVTALFATAGVARADEAPSAAGFWVTQDHGAVVDIEPCEGGLCGFIVGLRLDHPPNELIKDVHNPDPAKRADPICGLALMGSLKHVKGSAAKWDDGWIYDPESGSTYTVEAQLKGTDVLKLRGYLGISLFGRTETWTREPIDSAAKNRCVAPEPPPSPS